MANSEVQQSAQNPMGDGWSSLGNADQVAAIVASAGDAIVGKRLDGCIVSWNSAAEALFGYTAAEIVGRSVTLLLPPDRIHEEEEIISRIRRGERISHFETVRRHKSGRLIPVSVSISPVCDAAGRVFGASKIARDISDLVQARAREKRMANLLHALMRASKVIAHAGGPLEIFESLCRICVEHGVADSACLILADAEGVRSVASAGAASCSMLDVAKHPGRHAAVSRALAGRRCVLADSPAPLEGPVQGGEAAATADAAHSEHPVIAAIPIQLESLVGGVLVLEAAGIEFFDKVVMDLLEELASDISMALGNRSRDLEFKGIVDSAMDAIIAVDGEHRICRFNPSAEAMFQWSAEQAIGQAVDILIPSRFRLDHGALMRAFAANESAPRRMGVARPLTALRRDGTEFPIEATVSRFGEGADMRMIVVVRDASALRQAEAARRAQAEAEASNRAKTEFLSQMSHELRTPLNAVLGFTQVMLDDRNHPLHDEQRSQARHIRTAGRHLQTLINDLLDMARLESQQLRVDIAPVRLGPVLAEVMEVVTPMAGLADVTLVPELSAAQSLRVLADPTRLRQVLYNLLSNAIKYNRSGGSVQLKARVEDDRLVLFVADTGVGMTPEQLARLYEPYNRLGQERSGIDGLGIGLVVTKQLVEMMGGALSLTSDTGEGTCVSLALRIANRLDAPQAADAGDTGVDGEAADPDSPAEAVNSTMDHADEVAPESLHGVVLSIEDNPVNQLLLEAIFARWPRVTLLHARDGATGLRMVREAQPAVVLLDMHLPDMDGYAILGYMKGDPATRDTRVVALSANALPEDVARARAAGALDYLTKPLNLPQFVAALTALLVAERERTT